MKIKICALVLGLTFSFGSAISSRAMSDLVSLSDEPVWPTSSTPDGNLIYNITTVGRAGAGLLEITLSADNLPPGVTVTFSPSVLRFTGNQLTAQTATMTVSCPMMMPIDCYPFTITGTTQKGASMTVTNPVCYTANAIATRVPTLYLDRMTNGGLRLRGLGATGKSYQIQAASSLSNPVWTPLGSASADGNGRFTFFTNRTPGTSACFYRVVATN